MDRYFRWFGLPGAVVLSSLMSALALVLALCDSTPVRWLCFAAMALSSVGDVFLAHLTKLNTRFRSCFLIGTVFFMAAHIFYCLCYNMKLQAVGGSLWNPGTAIAGIIGISAAIRLLLLSLKSGRTQKLPLIFVYLAVILLNCTVVLSYAWAQRMQFSAVCAAVGMVSFLLSDLIIGLSLTGGIHRFDRLTWWLYPIGQILLILSA